LLEWIRYRQCGSSSPAPERWGQGHARFDITSLRSGPTAKMMWKLRRVGIIGFFSCTFLVCYPIPYMFVSLGIFRKPVVDIPVSLAEGKVRTNEFSSKNDEHYLILIRAQRRIPFAEMTCMMGVDFGQLNPSVCNTKPLLQADWSVWEGDRIVASGAAHDRGGGGSTDRTLERYIGHFSGQAGHKYVVEAKFTADGTALNKTGPHLIVEVEKPWD